jgi:hypothetical protein
VAGLLERAPQLAHGFAQQRDAVGQRRRRLAGALQRRHDAAREHQRVAHGGVELLGGGGVDRQALARRAARQHRERLARERDGVEEGRQVVLHGTGQRERAPGQLLVALGQRLRGGLERPRQVVHDRAGGGGQAAQRVAREQDLPDEEGDGAADQGVDEAVGRDARRGRGQGRDEDRGDRRLVDQDRARAHEQRGHHRQTHDECDDEGAGPQREHDEVGDRDAHRDAEDELERAHRPPPPRNPQRDDRGDRGEERRLVDQAGERPGDGRGQRGLRDGPEAAAHAAQAPPQAGAHLGEHRPRSGAWHRSILALRLPWAGAHRPR